MRLSDIEPQTYTVPVADLRRKCADQGHDPFLNPPWFGRNHARIGPIDPRLIDKTLDMEIEDNPHDDTREYSKSWHVKRIAYLVSHPDPEPLVIRQGVHDVEPHLYDGYHRLAAAIFRGDKSIRVELSGLGKDQLARWLS